MEYFEFMNSDEHPKPIEFEIKRFSIVAKGEVPEIDFSAPIAGCPLGLEYLYHTNMVFIKPYSGPHIVGRYSLRNKYEVINNEGKRIFLITNHITPKIDLNLSKDIVDEHKIYPVYMSVLNFMEDEIYQYYGIPGKMLKVGPREEISWGRVIKHFKRKNICHLSKCSNYLRYNIYMEEDETGKPIPIKDIKTSFVIKGKKQRTICLSDDTKKLYFGSFDCNIYEGTTFEKKENEDIESIGRISSSIYHEKLDMNLPGVEFPQELNVLCKATIVGALLVDIVRQ